MYLWRPWHNISVTCLTGNQPYDAEITIHGPHQTETIKIEVTCTETDETTMRRQALARDGFVSMTGPVWREGRQIVSELLMVDVAKERTALRDCAFARFQVKAEREDDPQTAILVYVNTPQSLPFWERAKLMEQTRTYLRAQSPIMYGVYYCYHIDRGIDSLRNNLHDLI